MLSPVAQAFLPVRPLVILLSSGVAQASGLFCCSNRNARRRKRNRTEAWATEDLSIGSTFNRMDSFQKKTKLGGLEALPPVRRWTYLKAPL